MGQVGPLDLRAAGSWAQAKRGKLVESAREEATMSTERSAHLKAPSLAFDLTVAVLIFFAATFAFVLMDAFEALYDLSRQYEEWELDDFILAGLALPLSLAWFAWRSQLRAQRHLKARVALEQDLRRSHDKLSILVSAAPGVHYISRPWGDFATTFVSPSVQSEFGYDPSEILSDAYYWTDRLHPDGTRFFHGHLQPHVPDHRVVSAPGGFALPVTTFLTH